MAKDFNLELAYNTYVVVYDNWGKLSDKQRKKARRQVEATISEAGIRGKSTGLISESAWQTVLNKYRGIKPIGGARTAKEHPITYKNIALHALTAPRKLSYEEYIALWTDNLVTTITTSDENYILQKLQKNFVFGVHSWMDMYDTAGIKLMKRPNLQRHDVKKQWGLM